jgi:signal peptidase I
MTTTYVLVLLALIVAAAAVWVVDGVFLAAARRHRVREIESLSALSPEERRARARAASQRSAVVEHARFFLPVLMLILGVRTCLAEPFRIPSGSMVPTLLVGDYILVNKFSYGVRLPVLNTKVLDVGEPVRGDVVVFRAPWAPGETWIKRVVGLPGDEVTYRNKTLYINGEEMAQVDVGAYTGPLEPQHDMASAELRTEQLGRVEHKIMALPMRRNGAEGTWTVPAGQYFMMGDSRDNSLDSRYNGFVPEENLVGKAFLIWMNFDHGIDFARIGMRPG